MEPAQYYIPTPKQNSSQELSRDDRLRIQTLYFDAGFIRDQICLQIGCTYQQVCYALQNRLTPQKKTRCGRKVVLSTPQRRKLVEWVTASRENRETPWCAIPEILGWDCGEKAIRTAFKREGFARRVERRKPALSAENITKRLAWAEEHKNWTEEQWFSILWSDETWAQPGKHTRVWCTRRVGEVYIGIVYQIDTKERLDGCSGEV